MKKKLVDITPGKYRCSFDASCPAVFKSNKRTYVIIGKTVDLREDSTLKGRVGDDETAIEISLDLIEDAIAASMGSKRA
jgi:hypothetical protein